MKRPLRLNVTYNCENPQYPVSINDVWTGGRIYEAGITATSPGTGLWWSTTLAWIFAGRVFEPR